MIAQRCQTFPYDIATHYPKACSLGPPATNLLSPKEGGGGGGHEKVGQARHQYQPRLDGYGMS